jgi:hypothetical protein
MVCAVALTATACNTKPVASDHQASASTRRSSSSSTSVLGQAATGGTTTTVAFSDEIADVKQRLAKASGNLCAMVDATHEQLHVTPQNVTEVHQAIDLLVAIIRAMGTVASARDGRIYNATADQLRADARQAGYSVAWIRSSRSSDALNDKDFVAASSRLETKYQATCEQTTTSSG